MLTTEHLCVIILQIEEDFKMNYKNISRKTVEESKNIPAPKKPTKLNFPFLYGALSTVFAIFVLCLIPNAVEKNDGVFGLVLNFLMFAGISIFFFCLVDKCYKQDCKDYELSKTNFREYQIIMQLRKEKIQHVFKGSSKQQATKNKKR